MYFYLPWLMKNCLKKKKKKKKDKSKREFSKYRNSDSQVFYKAAKLLS